MWLVVCLARANNLIISLSRDTKVILRFRGALINDRLSIDEAFSRAFSRCTPLLLVQAWVIQRGEGRFKRVGVGRRFLYLLLLREELGALGDAETASVAKDSVLLEFAGGLIRDVHVVTLRVVVETGTFGEGVKLLGSRCIIGMVADLLTICHAR